MSQLPLQDRLAKYKELMTLAGCPEAAACMRAWEWGPVEFWWMGGSWLVRQQWEVTKSGAQVGPLSIHMDPMLSWILIPLVLITLPMYGICYLRSVAVFRYQRWRMQRLLHKHRKAKDAMDGKVSQR